MLASVPMWREVGVPRLRIAGPDIRCPSGEFRAAGALCFQNEYSEVVWYGLTRLYYKAFAETKPVLSAAHRRKDAQTRETILRATLTARPRRSEATGSRRS